jgi:hypothetical protein
MTAVVTAVVRGGRAFSGSTAASVVDNVGGGRDGTPRPFRCCAVMIACAQIRPFQHSGARLSAVDDVACS